MIVASIVVGLLMTATVCFTAAVARSVSTTLTRPVNQLVDIIKGLNNRDFSQKVRARAVVDEEALNFPFTAGPMHVAELAEPSVKLVLYKKERRSLSTRETNS